ncbi:MAG: DUF4405 domain-containing protein [Anaerolineaceae bacterium]
MKTKLPISKETKKRFILNVSMFLLLIGVVLSSIYFLYVPAGYQGGRNLRYSVRIIFNRETWSDIHIWTSFILSALLFLHLIFHWSWFKNAFWRLIQNWKKNLKYNKLAFFNILDDSFAVIFFLLCLISGFVLFFIPGGKGSDSFLFLQITRETWKTIHIWTGIGMLVTVTIHLVIHWGWVKKISGRLFQKNSSIMYINSGK